MVLSKSKKAWPLSSVVPYGGIKLYFLNVLLNSDLSTTDAGTGLRRENKYMGVNPFAGYCVGGVAAAGRLACTRWVNPRLYKTSYCAGVASAMTSPPSSLAALRSAI